MNSTNSDSQDNLDPTNAMQDLASKDTPTTSATTQDEPEFGWSAYAERVNGRFAMIGFTAILLIEAITNQTFLEWASFFR